MNLDDSKDLQKIESKTKYWVFMIIELFVFGILFTVYFVNRYQNPSAFKLLSQELSTTYGIMNIVLLMVGSLTIVLSYAAIRNKNRFLSLLFLYSTLFIAFMYMIAKIIELYVLFVNGLYPKSEILINKAVEVSMFFWMFYSMSIFHILHFVFGIVLIFIALSVVTNNKNNFEDFSKVENANVFWQLICIIGLFIFPLFYLIN